MDVAKHVIDKCGGFDAVAEMLGCHVSRVYRWTYPPERGGTGGIIPSGRQVKLLKAARARGIELGPADFFPKDQAA
jgi:hypothetical protein